MFVVIFLNYCFMKWHLKCVRSEVRPILIQDLLKSFIGKAQQRNKYNEFYLFIGIKNIANNLLELSIKNNYHYK
jgi:hypothetical protein